MATKKSPGEASTEKVMGPASYFPSIEKKYGRPISEWKALIRANSTLRHMDLVNWLKTEHGMGHGHANALVAHTPSPRRIAADAGRHTLCLNR